MQSLVRSSRWMAAVLAPDARILSLSPSAEQFTGYSSQELAGRRVTEILADDSAFEVPRMLDAAREWGSWEGELVLLTRGARPLEARGAVTLLSGRANLPEGFLLVSNLSSVPAVDACENAAVADIAANLRSFAHDLNNPLAVLMGFTQLLVMDEGCTGRIREDIEKLFSEMKSLIRIVERLHGYAVSLQGKSVPPRGENVAPRSA